MNREINFLQSYRKDSIKILCHIIYARGDYLASLYQALDQAGIPIKLDIYERLPHVFQTFFHNSIESNIAMLKTNDFLKEYLNY